MNVLKRGLVAPHVGRLRRALGSGGSTRGRSPACHAQNRGSVFPDRELLVNALSTTKATSVNTLPLWVVVHIVHSTTIVSFALTRCCPFDSSLSRAACYPFFSLVSSGCEKLHEFEKIFPNSKKFMN